MPVSKYDFSAFEEDLKPKEKAPKEEAYDFSAFEEDVKKKETPSATESKPQPSKPFPTLESFGIDNRSFYTSAPKESTSVNKNIVTPEVEAQVETRKKNVQIAIDNTTDRALKNKGIKAPKNSPAYNAQRKKVEEAVNNGDAVYSVDPNTNTPALSQSTGFFESFWNGMMAASKAEEEANDFANMTTKERVEFANRKMVSTEEGYMGEAPSGMSSKISSTIGEAIPFLLKMGAGATAGAALVAAAPETLGASLAGLPAAMSLAFTTPDMVKQGGMSEVLTRFNMLKTQNPNMSDEVLMEEANKGYTAGGIVGGATNLAFGAVGGEAAKPLQKEVKNVLGGILKETIKGTAKSAATLGVVTGAGELAKGVERGIENKALKQSAQKNIDVAVDGLLGGATTGIILHMATSIATGAVKAPGLVKSGIKYALSKENPVELASVLKANEQLGNIPEGTTETVMSDIVDYNNALAKTSQDLSPETQASVAGLIQKRDKLVNEMSQLDPTQVEAYSQQVEAINEQIKNITNTGNPFEFELNQVGQRLSEAKLPEPSKELEAIENNRKLDLQELKQKLDNKEIGVSEYDNQVKGIDDYYNNLKQQYDKENITRVSSEVGVGEELIQAEPVEVGGTQETSGGGILQENVPSREGKVAEVPQGEIEAQKADIEKRRQADLNNEEFLKYPGKELTTFSEDDYRKMRIDDINAKYDAELNALEEKQKTEAPVPTKAEVTQEITDTEYSDFIDKGIVNKERLNDIAQKVARRENLTNKEREIFTDKTSDVNKAIAELPKTEDVDSKVKRLDELSALGNKGYSMNAEEIESLKNEIGDATMQKYLSDGWNADAYAKAEIDRFNVLFSEQAKKQVEGKNAIIPQIISVKRSEKRTTKSGIEIGDNKDWEIKFNAGGNYAMDYNKSMGNPYTAMMQAWLNEFHGKNESIKYRESVEGRDNLTWEQLKNYNPLQSIKELPKAEKVEEGSVGVGGDVEATAKALEGKDIESIVKPKNTKIVDENGQPIKLYHVSENEIKGDIRTINNHVLSWHEKRPENEKALYQTDENGNYTEIGFHLGGEKTVKDFIDRYGINPKTKLSVFLDIKNPIEIKDLTAWTPTNIIKEIGNMGYDIGELKNKYTAKEALAILNKLGIDGFKYENIHEYTGEKYSYMAIHPEQIKVIDNKSIAEAYHKAKSDGSNPELVKAVEQSLKELPKAKAEAPVPSEKPQGIEGVEQEVTIEKMKPFTDRMVEIEREFKNNEYEIDTDYDNEIQVLDKNGEQVEPSELPKNLSSLAADYEKATSKLGEFDASAREKALAESRKVVEAEAEVVEPKKKELPPTEEGLLPVQEKPQEPIIKTEKPTINKDNKGQEPFVTRNKKQMVKINQNGTAIVTDMQGKPVSRAVEKKALREYAKKFDYSIGTKAEESGNKIYSTRDMIIESENPLEIAEIYASEELTTANLSATEAMIYDYGVGKVTNNSFRRYNDVNNITMSLAKSYLNNREGRGLDQIAKDMSDHYFPEGNGTEISPEDVADFMVRFPSGTREAGKLMETDIAREAAEKFKQLTGLYLNREIADVAVNQQFELLSKEQQKLLEYEYKNQSELEKDYWNTYAKTDGFTKEIPVGEAKQAKAAPRKKVGNFEAKAQKIADKIMATELPSWFSIADKDVTTKGIDAESMKRALADAVVNMGKLLDSGVEFSEALKQSVKELVGIKGEENRESIEKGFEEYYKAQVPLEENPFENIPRTQVARDKYFDTKFGENADRAREIYNQGGTPAEMLSKMETPIDKDKLGGEIRGITMKDNAERREAIGMEERKPNPSSVEQWRAEAQKRISEGYNINNLIEKMERGDLIDEVDNEITRIFMATLDAEVMKNPSNENIAKSMQLIKLSENAGSKQGSILRSRQGLSNPLEKISDFYVAEMESLNVGELTETQKKKIQQQFDGIQAAKEEYRKKYEEAQAKFAEMQAQDELLKQKRELKAKPSSEAKDYVAERQSLKEKLRQAVEKYKNNANKMGIASDGGAENFAITVEMAKIISQIAKSHVEEVGAKLVEVTRRTLDDVKDLFDGITDKDIRDIIAGKYSERKETKSELAANLRQLKAEAGLLNELDRVIAGEPKTEKARIEKNQRLAEIRRQINEVKKNNGLEEYSTESRTEKATEAVKKNIKELEDKIAANDLDVKNAEKINSPELEILRNKQKKLRDEIEAKRKEAGAGQYSEEARAKKAIEANKRRQKEIEERIANNDFDAPEKRESIYESSDFKRNNQALYNELLDSQVKMQETELEFHKKLVENEMASMGKMDKLKLVMKKAGGTLRAFFAGIDDSAVGVQNWFRAVRNPVIGTRAIRDHVLDFWSQKRFDRTLTELYNSPDYKAMKESGLQISNPKSLLEEGKEELFPTRFRAIIKLNGKEYGWMNIGGKKYELLDVLKPFERAFTSLGNSLRVISFRTAAAKLESKGITFEKNPEEYKKLATRINAQTSASQPNKAFQSELLNLGVWSPRLMTSKLNLLGVSDLASYTPLVKQGYYRSLGEKGKVLSRQQLYAAYDLAQFAASIVAGSYLYAAARGGDVNTNPFDDRFMDVELPNGKSYNFTGGFSKYIAALFQITSGGKVDRKTGLYKEYSGFKDRGSEVLHFMRGKMPPISGSVVNLAVGKDYTGNETSLSSEAEKYKMPMAIAQISRQLENDGYSSLFGDGIPTFLGISVKDKRDYKSPNPLFDPNVDLQLPEFKTLIEKGIEIPELGNREKYKVDKTVKHPDEVMTPEEFDIFKDLVEKYMKEGYAEPDTDTKVGGIKEILNTSYVVEMYNKEDEIEKEEYVLGKNLTKEQLESKINELKSKAIKKAKEEMMLVEKKPRIVVKKEE